MTEINTEIYSPLMKPTNPMEQTNHLLDTAAKAQHIQTNNIGIDNAQVDLAMKRIGIFNSAVSSLLGDPDLGKKDLMPKIGDVVSRLVKDNVLTSAHAAEALKSIPTDPGQQAISMRNIHSQLLSAEQRGHSFFGSPSVIDDGASKRITQVPSYPGLPVSERGVIANQLPPTTPQVQGDPTKPNYGAGGYVGPSGPAGFQQGGQPPGFPSLPSLPSRPRQSPAGLDQVSPMSSLPPGRAEASNVAGGESGRSVADARNRSLNYQQEVFPLEQAIPALEKLGTRGTGPGTESINHLKSFVLSNVPGADFKGMKDDVATFDKAKKYLTDFVNQNGNSGTNDKLAAAFAGNPSVGISNAAAVDVAKSALTLRRFKQAQLIAFESSGKPEAEFAKEAGKFAREHDPRAYGFDMMTPQQRKSVLESLPKGKRELFMLDVQDAATSGTIKTPQVK